ncbi:uncharacterized protein ASCRUDRAFT_74254 [Ascoidea rubescens DSM 1968]|uniref:Uncharacterized protein n=1 Tax=Ascoidea rubescens DSM 1968 TaxID=1344418 RepID=A0A1D2VMF0_9ASCO|nr:hypothetical protein ASCRUDRAFT_74254 [Ascoidea rubescens DSM 1968]ODV62782.1 hypothetical protein ASCRUDRAFT_74254 [Ascoidea rubescens DSM 1968]
MKKKKATEKDIKEKQLRLFSLADFGNSNCLAIRSHETAGTKEPKTGASTTFFTAIIKQQKQTLL